MKSHVSMARARSLFILGVAAILNEGSTTCSFQSQAKAESSADSPQAAQSGDSAIQGSVVKVFSKLRYPDLWQPWTKAPSMDATGSGVVIEGKRILSNAHVVLYASQVQIQASQSGDKISARVEAIAPAIDLAVLKLDDESFFDTHPALPRAVELPQVKDAVMAYGYPEGGNSLSITKGIVSRIEFTTYNQDYPASGLRIQIDAALNPGNSGGAAVAGGKMIGLAFASLGSAQNIGYIIPCEEIELFLKDIADGKYDGKPAMYDDLQTLENPALRAFLKLPKGVTGMVVHKPCSAAANYPLKQWDVITQIGDTAVDDQGMIKLGTDLRVNFQYMLQKVSKNGQVALTVMRSGQEVCVNLPLTSRRARVIPVLDGAYPSFFVYGPMVFSSATVDFVRGLTGAKDADWPGWLRDLGSPLMTRFWDKPTFEGERLVVISSKFFPHKLAIGYSEPFAHVLKSVNGVAVKNLPHLVELLRDSKDDYLRFEFDSRGGETLVFSRTEMVAATEEILADNALRSQGSPDVMTVWNSKK